MMVVGENELGVSFLGVFLWYAQKSIAVVARYLFWSF